MYYNDDCLQGLGALIEFKPCSLSMKLPISCRLLFGTTYQMACQLFREPPIFPMASRERDSTSVSKYKIIQYLRQRRIKASNIQHACICWVCNGELCTREGAHNQLCSISTVLC